MVAMDLAPYAQAKWQGTGQGCRPLGRQTARLGSQVRRNHGGRGSPGAPGPKGKIVNSQVRREQADLTVSKQRAGPEVNAATAWPGAGALGCCPLDHGDLDLAVSHPSQEDPPHPASRQPAVTGSGCHAGTPRLHPVPSLLRARLDLTRPRAPGPSAGRAARGSLSRHCDHP